MLKHRSTGTGQAHDASIKLILAACRIQKVPRPARAGGPRPCCFSSHSLAGSSRFVQLGWAGLSGRDGLWTASAPGLGQLAEATPRGMQLIRMAQRPGLTRLQVHSIQSIAWASRGRCPGWKHGRLERSLEKPVAAQGNSRPKWAHAPPSSSTSAAERRRGSATALTLCQREPCAVLLQRSSVMRSASCPAGAENT